MTVQEAEAVLCAGGCGQALTASEIRNQQKTRKGHGRGKCPGQANGAPVASPPPVKAPPTVGTDQALDSILAAGEAEELERIQAGLNLDAGLAVIKAPATDTGPARVAETHAPKVTRVANPEPERQYRHEHVLQALRGLHFVPELTCPAFGGGVGWHVRLEAAHMPEDELHALKEFLGYE
jgi:hypothetical protein